MSLIHPTLIAAAGLAVIPVILHFLLRAKPRKLVFPALRLIQLRRRQNVRRLRLRHFWLMLLRVLVIVGLVIAVARPSVPEANYELSTRELVTLIGVIAAAVGTYFGLMRYWRKKQVSVQTLAYRRTMLRGGVGAALAALIVLLVVWPYANRLRAEISAPAPVVGSDLPVAAVFLFDTSLSMQYQQEGKTRLDQAKTIALSHIELLPPRSRIAVGESAAASPILFQADTVTAKSKIQNLVLQPATQPLNERLRAALALQQADQGRTLDEQQSVAQDARRDRFLREVYVFTDLAASAWRTGSTSLLKEELERLSWIGVYVIDVGEPEPRDIALTEIVLARQSVPAGSTLLVEATVTAIGFEESEKTVELSLLSRDGKLLPSGRQPVKIGAKAGVESQSRERLNYVRTRVQIPVSNLQGPVQHGELRLLSSDPLAMNDVRHFTLEVKPPPKVLLVSPSAAVSDVLKEVLAPPGLAQTGKARYEVEDIRPSKLAGSKLSDYSVVVLNSVPSVTEPVWKSLHKYVSNGGGLLIALGSSATPNDATGVSPETYNTDFAKTLLPATLAAPLNFNPAPQYFDPKNLEHPVFKKLEEAGAAELAAVELRRHWRVDLQDGANVLMSYSNSLRDAALIERRIGTGRVMMLTTALDLRGWNELPRSWSFVALSDQLMQYLSGRQEAAFNFLPGEEVTIRLGGETPPQKFLVRKPGGQQHSDQLGAGATTISIRETEQLGHYDVISADPQSNFASGFSVNAPAAESDFRRLTDDELTQMLGEKRFALARDIATLERRVNTGRLGEELYPLLLLVAILVFCGEHFVANWFYSEEAETVAA